MTRTLKILPWLLASLCGIAAYEVPFADTDWSPQTCSGMFGGSNAFINGKRILVTVTILLAI